MLCQAQHLSGVAGLSLSPGFLIASTGTPTQPPVVL
jgi:hypothetical protein